MGFVQSRMAGRFPVLSRVGDVVLVGGVVLRFANRRGLISDETLTKVGAPSSSGGSGLSAAEIALAAAAAVRLVNGVRKRRS